MKTIQLKSTMGAVILFIASSSLTACSKSSKIQTTAPTENTQVSVTEVTTSFKIEEMTCATCPISVKKAMKRVDGVLSVEVDFETKTAIVVYDPSLTTSMQIAAASTNVGYPAHEVNL